MTHYRVWMKGKEEHAATLDATSSFEARRIAAAASNVHIGKIMARAITEDAPELSQPAPKGGGKAETSTEDAWTDAAKLEAIRARIQGVWDNAALVKLGPLGNKDEDIIRILDKAETNTEEQSSTPRERRLEAALRSILAQYSSDMSHQDFRVMTAHTITEALNCGLDGKLA